MKDRVPKYPGRTKMTRADGSVEYVTLVRADEPQVVGTPLNKESLLSDATAAKLWTAPTGNETVNDALGMVTPIAKLETLYQSSLRVSNVGYNSNVNANTALLSNLMNCSGYDYLSVRVTGTLSAKSTNSSDTVANLVIGEDSRSSIIGSVRAGGGLTERSNQISGTITFEKYTNQYGNIRYMALNAANVMGEGNGYATDPTRIAIGGGTSSAITCYVSGTLTVTIKGAKKAGIFA